MVDFFRFEGSAFLKQEKGKAIFVHVVVMTDLVFFVQENNQKYMFVNADNKVSWAPFCKQTDVYGTQGCNFSLLIRTTKILLCVSKSHQN